MAKITFSPLGAYITSWQIDDREILYHGSELKRGGIPLLFPNFDAGAPLPNHGFGRLSQWQIIDQSNNSCHLRLTDQDIAPDFRQIYPYQFSADLEVKAINNYLDYQLTVTNLGSTNLPISPGLHPYWPVKHSEKSKIIIQDISNDFDWDNHPPDNFYDFNHELIINFPQYQLKIEDTCGYFKHLQVWSQNTSFPDHNFVCFEPITRPKNGLNTDPILVTPHQSIELKLRFTCLLS